ncbi:MAG: 4Fe-4S dicluster domain-containing protein [Clostridia bacterium]
MLALMSAQFDAVHVTNGIAKVDESKCVGCGACVSACPKNVIRLIPQSQRVRVACSGQDRGRDVKALCQAGMSWLHLVCQNLSLRSHCHGRKRSPH